MLVYVYPSPTVPSKVKIITRMTILIALPLPSMALLLRCRLTPTITVEGKMMSETLGKGMDMPLP